MFLKKWSNNPRWTRKNIQCVLNCVSKKAGGEETKPSRVRPVIAL